MASLEPVHASTVVLLRAARPDGRPTIFLVKRHSKSAFMANAYVYPGGKLDRDDTTAETTLYCSGLNAKQAIDHLAPSGPRLQDDTVLSDAQALGLYVAAVREVFEESGVLLARDIHGEWVNLEHPDVGSRFAQHRTDLNSGTLSMTELARREHLSYPLDALHYMGHWITPTFERRRFNTRFYIAIAPAGQEPLHDDKEVVASAWWTPSEAIDRYRTGEIQLAPPTFRTLEEMSAYNSVETLVKGMTQGPIPTIMPRLESIDGAMTLILPGDPLMPSHTGVEGPTRLVLEDDQWWSRHP